MESFMNGPALLATMLGALGTYLLASAVMAAVFGKMRIPAWKAFVPLYGTFVWLKETTRSTALAIVGILVPVANFIIPILAGWKACKGFGKGVGFFVMSLFFTPIAAIILGVGSADWDVCRIDAAAAPDASIVRGH